MTVLEVAAGLVFRDGLLLITQRPPDKHLGGLWEFPGGKLHAGETWEVALQRELHEELGFEAKVGELFEEIVHHYPEKSVRLRFFRCAVASGEPQPIECAALAWVEPAQLGQYPFPPADAQLIDRLAKGS